MIVKRWSTYSFIQAFHSKQEMSSLKIQKQATRLGRAYSNAPSHQSIQEDLPLQGVYLFPAGRHSPRRHCRWYHPLIGLHQWQHSDLPWVDCRCWSPISNRHFPLNDEDNEIIGAMIDGNQNFRRDSIVEGVVANCSLVQREMYYAMINNLNSFIDCYITLLLLLFFNNYHYYVERLWLIILH